MTKELVGRLRPEQLAAILRDDERARVRATLPMGIDEAEVDRIAAMSVTWEAANLLDSLSPPDGVGLTLETTAEERSAVFSYMQTRDQDSFGYRAARDIDTLTAALAAEKARAEEEGQRLLRAYEELADAEDRADTAEARCDTLAGALREANLWIRNWSPDFTEDDGWPDVQAMIDAALATIPAKPETQP